jgi:hypothetical protein
MEREGFESALARQMAQSGAPLAVIGGVAFASIVRSEHLKHGFVRVVDRHHVPSVMAGLMHCWPNGNSCIGLAMPEEPRDPSEIDFAPSNIEGQPVLYCRVIRCPHHYGGFPIFRGAKEAWSHMETFHRGLLSQVGQDMLDAMDYRRCVADCGYECLGDASMAAHQAGCQVANSKQAVALPLAAEVAVDEAAAAPPLPQPTAATDAESTQLRLLCHPSAHRDFDTAVAAGADVPRLHQVIVTGLLAAQLGEGTNISP